VPETATSPVSSRRTGGPLGGATAASICMHEAIELGKIQPGHLVCLVALRAGLTRRADQRSRFSRWAP
jgi:3-oxoacyl-[acyl-carrier-protein] synthase III